MTTVTPSTTTASTQARPVHSKTQGQGHSGQKVDFATLMLLAETPIDAGSDGASDALNKRAKGDTDADSSAANAEFPLSAQPPDATPLATLLNWSPVGRSSSGKDESTTTGNTANLFASATQSPSVVQSTLASGAPLSQEAPLLKEASAPRFAERTESNTDALRKPADTVIQDAAGARNLAPDVRAERPGTSAGAATLPVTANGSTAQSAQSPSLLSSGPSVPVSEAQPEQRSDGLQPAANGTPQPSTGTAKSRSTSWRSGAASGSPISTVKLATAQASRASLSDLNTGATPTVTALLQQAAAETHAVDTSRDGLSVDSLAESAASVVTRSDAPASREHNETTQHQSGGGPGTGQPDVPHVSRADEHDLTAPTAPQDGAPEAFSEWMDQLADQVSYWTSQGTQTASLTVDEGGLNPVDIQVTMDNGKVDVTFSATESATLDALKAQAETTLKAMLEHQGMSLNQVSVDPNASGLASQNQSAGQDTSRDRSAQARNAAPSRSAALDTTLPPATATRRSADPQRLDLFA